MGSEKIKYSAEEEMEIGYPVYAKYRVALGLRATELQVYALVRSFGDKGFFGTYGYVASMIGVSYSAVWRAFSSLIGRGYIIKDVDVGRYKDTVIYRANAELEEKLVADFLEKQRKRRSLESEQRIEAARQRVRRAMEHGARRDSEDGTDELCDAVPVASESRDLPARTPTDLPQSACAAWSKAPRPWEEDPYESSPVPMPPTREESCDGGGPLLCEGRYDGDDPPTYTAEQSGAPHYEEYAPLDYLDELLHSSRMRDVRLTARSARYC